MLGLVPYLNILPLLEELDSVFPRENWVRATPRELSLQLAQGQLDIALLSIIEGIQFPDRYRLIPGAAIGSNGPVRSVRLFSKIPISEIKTVLLDKASLTSINLMKILLAEMFDLAPDYRVSQTPINREHQWEPTVDAAVVIGDTALAWENQFPYELDAGEAWKTLTGLPFVFAGWLVRKDSLLSEKQIKAFEKARIAGRNNITKIVDQIPDSEKSLYGGADSLRQYFTEAIRYELGDKELEGINLFRDKLLRHQLIRPTEQKLELATSQNEI